MKKALLTLCMIFLASGAAARDLTRSYTLNPAAGGDTVKEALVGLDAEITRVYGYVETVYMLQAGSAPPASNNQQYDVYLDTDSTPPTLLYYTGSQWDPIFTSTFASGLTQDQVFVGFTKNVILTRASASSLQVTASSSSPATVGIDSSRLYQNTSAVTVAFPGDTSSGVYDIVASQSGSTTTFALTKQSSPYTVGVGERIVGQAKFNTDTNDFVWIRSYEARDITINDVPHGFFLAKLTSDGSQSTAESTYTKVQLGTVVYDFDNYFDYTTNYRYTPAVAGVYEICASVDYDETGESSSCVAALYVNGTKTWEAAGTSTFDADTNTNRIATGCAMLYLDGDDYVELYAMHRGGSAGSVALQSDHEYGTAMWGRFIGRKY